MAEPSRTVFVCSCEDSMRLDAESRLGLSNPAASFDAASEPPVNALQTMYVTPAKEKTLSDAVKEAFGFGVVLNRLGGNQLRLYVGEPVSAAIADTESYLNEFKDREALHEQGDGVRSYVGILLAALAAPWPVLLIDEPAI